MDKLTIRELAPYLSYGLNFKAGNETWLLRSLRTLDKYPIWAETRWYKKENKYKPEINNRGLCIGYGFKLKDIKPLLRPLSFLTEEIEHNGERFVPIIELFKLRTQGTGDKIADYYIENDTAILRLEAQHLDEYEFRAFFEIDLEPNEVMFSIATETWKDEVMTKEDVNLCGNEMTMFEKLNEWHFDTANLLGRGLALPIDGKEVEGC